MLRIRLARLGRRSRPHYRVVVAERRWGRDGRRIDDLGHYDPLTEPSTVVLDVPRTEEWMRKGAQPTERVSKLLEIARSARDAEPPVLAEAEPKAKATSKGKAEPKVKATSKGKAKPKAKATSKGKAKPKAKATSKGKAKPKATSKAAPKAKARVASASSKG